MTYAQRLATFAVQAEDDAVAVPITLCRKSL